MRQQSYRDNITASIERLKCLKVDYTNLIQLRVGFALLQRAARIGFHFTGLRHCLGNRSLSGGAGRSHFGRCVDHWLNPRHDSRAKLERRRNLVVCQTFRIGGQHFDDRQKHTRQIEPSGFVVHLQRNRFEQELGEDAHLAETRFARIDLGHNRSGRHRIAFRFRLHGLAGFLVGERHKVPDVRRVEGGEQEVRRFGHLDVAAAERHRAHHVAQDVVQDDRSDFGFVQQGNEDFVRFQVDRLVLQAQFERATQGLDQDLFGMLVKVGGHFGGSLERRIGGSVFGGHFAAQQPRVEASIERHVTAEDGVEAVGDESREIELRQQRCVEWESDEQEFEGIALDENDGIVETGTQSRHLGKWREKESESEKNT